MKKIEIFTMLLKELKRDAESYAKKVEKENFLYYVDFKESGVVFYFNQEPDSKNFDQVDQVNITHIWKARLSYTGFTNTQVTGKHFDRWD